MRARHRLAAPLLFAVLAAPVCGGGEPQKTGGGNGDLAGSVVIDCNANPAKACDTWQPANDPFDGTFTIHTCTAWRDGVIEVHAASAASCKVPADAPPGKKVDLLDACPTANRAGGCMVATEAGCEVNYFYADDSVIAANRKTPADIMALCASLGGTYVK